MEIINDQLKNPSDNKRVYKVDVNPIKFRKGPHCSSSIMETDNQTVLNILRERFVRLTINPFIFDGKAAYAIFISDVTKKTARKVNDLDIMEKH